MKKYVLDYRPAWKKYKDVSDFNINILGLDAKIDKEHPREFGFESKHSYNVLYEQLEEGMHLYLCDEPPFTNLPYGMYEIEITHIYGGIIFYKLTDYPDEGEKHASKMSVGFPMGLYPYEIIVSDGFTIKCAIIPAEKVKITIDNDESTIGKYPIYDSEKFDLRNNRI